MGATTATFLFTDLADSTALLTRLGDEAFDRLRIDHDAALSDAIRRAGGRIVKHTGDGFMAVFNAAADAVMASVGVQRAAERLALGVRVGVSAGDVTEEDGDYFGQPVVEAKRLCDAAHPGQIVVADVVRVLAGSRGNYAYSVLAPFELKGLAGPRVAHEVNWSLDELPPLPTQLDAAAARPLIGRGDELTAALNALTQGSDVVIAGEPGIGKTRFVAELAARMASARAEVLYGRCEEQPVASYEPWIEALNLRSPFDLAPERSTGDPEESRLEFFESVRARLCGVSGRGHVICVLEDVQWADRPSLLLLRFLLRPPTDPRMLFALTYRESEVGRRHPFGEVLADLHRDAATCRITLRGLQLVETRALVAQTSGHAQSEPFVAAVQRETEGNPFFVQQVVANLLETGSSVERFSLPESVREVVGRRLARLSDETNRLLAIAAVVGREFDLELVARVANRDVASVLDCVDEARATGVVVEQPDSFDRFAFGHALLRATLLEEFSTARRVRLHRDVAEAIEILHADNLDEHCSALAYHWTEAAAAGDPLRAVPHVIASARQRWEHFAWEEAIEYCRQALALLDGLASPLQEYDARMLLSSSLALAGELLDGQHEAVAAAKLAHRINDPRRFAAAVMLLATGPIVVPDIDRGTYFQSALEWLDDADSIERCRLLAIAAGHAAISPTNSRLSHEQAEAAGLEAVAMAERLGDPYAIARTYLSLYNVRWGQPDAEALLTLTRRMLDHTRAAGGFVEGISPHRLVLPLCRLGRGSDLEQALSDAAASATRTHAPAVAAELALYRGAIALTEARFDDARAAGRELLTLAPRDSGVRAGAFDQRLRRAWELGEMDTVGRLLDESAPFLDAFPALAAHRAVWCAFLGRFDEAGSLIDDLVADDAARLPWNYGRPRALHDLAEAVGLVGHDAAAKALHPLVRPYDGELLCSFNPTTIDGAAATSLGILETVLGRDEEAEAHFRSALSLEEGFGATLPAAITRFWHARLHGPHDPSTMPALLDEARAFARARGAGRLLTLCDRARSAAHE